MVFERLHFLVFTRRYFIAADGENASERSENEQEDYALPPHSLDTIAPRTFELTIMEQTEKGGREVFFLRKENERGDSLLTHHGLSGLKVFQSFRVEIGDKVIQDLV
jgi:hypothetical protein